MTGSSSGSPAASGWHRAWRQISGRAPHIESMAVFTRPASPEGHGTLRSLGFELTELSAAMLGDLSSFRRPDQVELLRRHLGRGGRAWSALRGGGLAGYACLAVPQHGVERHRFLRLYPDEASAILMFTRPEFRGLGLGRGFLHELTAVACTQYGATTMVGWTAAHNRASCRMHLAAGYEPAGTVDVLMLWYRPIWTWTHGGTVRR